jgi:CRISPR-associated RAMP protein (TIGR02581 family)
MLTFERRYLFTGTLTLTTALHIGGGRGTLSASDSPIVRGPDLKPFIPGSSFKGSFRSTVEKLVPALPNLRTCALTDGEGDACPGAPGEVQKEFSRLKERWDEGRLVEELEARLCDTCKLFGSTFQASRILFDDLQIKGSNWAGVTQVRDGVAIDRDSERAVDRLKYDFEVVPPEAEFEFRLTLEEPTDADLGLACLGLSEFVAGFGGIGGKRSRGLGRCQLEDLKIYELDLRAPDRVKHLRKYLLGKSATEKMTLVANTEAFLQTNIVQLLEGGE